MEKPFILRGHFSIGRKKDKIDYRDIEMDVDTTQRIIADKKLWYFAPSPKLP